MTESKQGDLQRLLHDVAKYIVRAAVNLPEQGPVPAVLVDMLIADLYGDGSRAAASATFDRFAPSPLPASLQDARRALDDIEALQTRVRAREEAAIREAAMRARDVSAAIHRAADAC